MQPRNKLSLFEQFSPEILLLIFIKLDIRTLARILILVSKQGQQLGLEQEMEVPLIKKLSKEHTAFFRTVVLSEFDIPNSKIKTVLTKLNELAEKVESYPFHKLSMQNLNDPNLLFGWLKQENNSLLWKYAYQHSEKYFINFLPKLKFQLMHASVFQQTETFLKLIETDTRIEKCKKILLLEIIFEPHCISNEEVFKCLLNNLELEYKTRLCLVLNGMVRSETGLNFHSQIQSLIDCIKNGTVINDDDYQILCKEENYGKFFQTIITHVMGKDLKKIEHTLTINFNKN